ncbi:hypothetical protein [Aliamphritea spongicola]|nr:hypothetical protein [Aliamphritea spongicola]
MPQKNIPASAIAQLQIPAPVPAEDVCVVMRIRLLQRLTIIASTS